MLDELFELDRDGRKEGATAGQRQSGIRGFFGRLLGGLTGGDGDENDYRRDGRRVSHDDHDDYDDDRGPERRGTSPGGGDRRKRERERDGFDFGGDD